MSHSTIHKGSKTRASNGGLDQYYTKPFIADFYSNIILNMFGGSVDYIEPSAGTGVFLNILPNIKGYDIDPKNDSIEQKDLFDIVVDKNTVLVGNPPFGTSGSLAIKVFNHFANQNCKAIAFIVPKTFKKVSVSNKLNLNYKIVLEQDLLDSTFIVDGKSKYVPCVFQVWTRTNKPRKLIDTPKNEWLQFVSNKEEYTVAVRRAGSKAGKILKPSDSLSPSSTYFIVCDNTTIKALKLIDTTVASNTAGVKSISKLELISEVNKIMEVLCQKSVS